MVSMWSNWNSQTFLVGRQSLWNRVWKCLIKLSVHLWQINPANPFLGIYPRKLKTYVHIKTCTWMFLAALFTIAPTETNPHVQPQVNGWRSCGMNRPYAMYHVQSPPYVLEYHLAIKRNKLSDTYSTNESHGLYIEWRKPDTIDYILYHSLLMWRNKTLL